MCYTMMMMANKSETAVQGAHSVLAPHNLIHQLLDLSFVVWVPGVLGGCAG